VVIVQISPSHACIPEKEISVGVYALLLHGSLLADLPLHAAIFHVGSILRVYTVPKFFSSVNASRNRCSLCDVNQNCNICERK